MRSIITIILHCVIYECISAVYICVSFLAVDDFSTSDITVNFAPSQSESCVEVPVVSDNIPEDDETFIVEIQTSDDYVIGEPPSAEITIIDSDRGEYVKMVHIRFIM